MSIIRTKGKSTVLIASAVALLGVAACTPAVKQHGNMLRDDQVAEIAPGVHTRTEVLRLLGSPTTKAAFDDNIWYYIGQETQKRGILDPEVTENRVYVVTFNDKGKVQDIGQIDEEMINVSYSDDKTPTHGNDITVMQQLLGNLGRFNPQTGNP